MTYSYCYRSLVSPTAISKSKKNGLHATAATWAGKRISFHALSNTGKKEGVGKQFEVNRKTNKNMVSKSSNEMEKGEQSSNSDESRYDEANANETIALNRLIP